MNPSHLVSLTPAAVSVGKMMMIKKKICHSSDWVAVAVYGVIAAISRFTQLASDQAFNRVEIQSTVKREEIGP